MKLLIVTDAWHPQVNGVVNSLESVAKAMRMLGASVDFLTPEGFMTIPMPTYPDIRLSIIPPFGIGRRIEAFGPDYVHIATEGPLGLAARAYCKKRRRLFTTSYHTRFPEYLSARLPVPERWTYMLLRWFHNGAAATMVSTHSVRRELEARGFRNLLMWSRGVDHIRFCPRSTRVLDVPRPVFLYVGRVAVEKTIENFLSLDLPGSKVVVGDGPARAALEAQFPAAHFLGMKSGEPLAEVYASADVFVFPSKTDTFGIVLLEALASGLPVAAYPVMGPMDVLDSCEAGVLDADLRKACLDALTIPRQKARDFALRFTWEQSARQFLANIELACTRKVKGIKPEQMFSEALPLTKDGTLDVKGSP